MHVTQCHSEYCNGYTHAVLCDNPEVHDRMTSYFLCNENCSVYQIRKKNLKLRMPVRAPAGHSDSENKGEDIVEYPLVSEHDVQLVDVLPADADLLQVTSEPSPKKQLDINTTQRSKTRNPSKRNNFYDLHRRLSLLEERIAHVSTPHKYESKKRAPRRIHLNKA